MGLRMITPWKHPRSDNLWFRKRVPDRFRAFMGGLREIKESLGTSSMTDAKLLCQERNVHYERLWRDHLDRPQPSGLTRMQAVALAGELYREVVEAHKQNPGRPADWEQSLKRHEANRKLVVPFPGAVAQNRRYRYGNEAQAFLSARGLTLDHASYDLFLQAYVEAKILAEQQLQRYAANDYTPIEGVADRFPSMEAADPDYSKAPALATFDQYAAEAGLKSSTRKRWRGLIEKFVAFLGHDDLARVSRDDIVKWKKKLLLTKQANGKPIANVTIRDAYIASIKATLEWLYEQDGMTGESPAYEVKVRVKKNKKLREKGFTKPEAETILMATLRTPSEKMSVEMAAARRWVPWICAYTGARVNEITMLRPVDIDIESGIHVFRIRGDATKTDEYRNVPIHDHLIEQGFLKYAASRGAQPLFYDPRRSRGGKDSNPHYQKVAERLAEWVRVDLKITGVQPNHGWRHRFSSLARAVDMHVDIQNIIQGHVGKKTAGDYGDAWVEVAKREISKIPAYKITADKRTPKAERIEARP
jgi:integrase